MTSLVVVSAGLSNPSSTRLLAERLTAATVEALGAAEEGSRSPTSSSATWPTS